MITNPEAVRFCNEKARPLADSIESMYETCRRFITEYNSNGIGTLCPNDSTVVDDKAAIDGRKIITGAMIHSLADRAFELIALLEATSNAKLVQIQAISVNGRALY